MNETDAGFSYGLADHMIPLANSVPEIIEQLFDQTLQPGETRDQAARRITWPIKIEEFRPMRINVAIYTTSVLERLLEDLDEDYADPDGDSTTPTDTMREAARAFVGVVAKEYKVWSCEPTGKVISVSREEALRMVQGEA